MAATQIALGTFSLLKTPSVLATTVLRVYTRLVVAPGGTVRASDGRVLFPGSNQDEIGVVGWST